MEISRRLWMGLTHPQVNQLICRSPVGFFPKLVEWRCGVAADIGNDSDPLGLTRKLLVDYTVPNSPEPLLRMLGFVHLYTLSGIHIYAMLAATEFIFKALSRLTRRSMIWIRLFQMTSILMVTVLWALQGFRLGFLRPFFVFGFKKWCAWRGIRLKSVSPILILLLFEMIGDWMGWWISRWIGMGDNVGSGTSSPQWHYFLAVGGAAVAYRWAISQPELKHRPLICHAIMALGAWITTAMMDVIELKQVAPWTPLISLVTIPLVAQISLPVLFLCLAHFTWFKFVSRSLNTVMMWMASIVADHGGVYFVRSGAFIPLFAVTALILFACHKKKPVVVGLMLVMSILIAAGLRWNLPRTTDGIEMLNVGQGDGMVSVTPNQSEGIDGGKTGQLKDRDWIDLFSSHEWALPTTWIISHWDEDHAGALRRLTRLFPIDCVAVHPQAFEEDRGLRWKAFFESRKITQFDPSCVKTGWVLPVTAQIAGHHKQSSGNEKMLCFFRDLPDGRMYVGLGDSSIDMEQAWISASQDQLKNRLVVWKVNHHGSKTSTPDQLADEVKLSEAWLSVGAHNPYGHPSDRVMQKFSEWAISIRRTDRDGNITSWGDDPSDWTETKEWVQQMWNKLTL